MDVPILLNVLIYGALFGPIAVALVTIVSNLNERNQAEIEFLRTVQEKLYLQHALREAELRQLHSQIKSHFLFNTLNTIRNFVLLGRRREAVAVVEALSVAFRYSLQKSGLIVPLRDELRYVRSYLEIQQARFGPRLTVDLDVDEALGWVGIPYMSIQTLVENAIEHGVERKPGRRHVALQVAGTGGDLVVVVTDDGAGLPERITVELMQVADDHPLLSRVGLRNVRQRLQRHYPQRSSLRLGSEPGRGCTAELRIPLAQAPAEQGEGDAVDAPTQDRGR